MLIQIYYWNVNIGFYKYDIVTSNSSVPRLNLSVMFTAINLARESKQSRVINTEVGFNKCKMFSVHAISLARVYQFLIEKLQGKMYT